MFFKLLAGILTLFSGFLGLSGLYEYYIVGILKATDQYPFGDSGPVPYYYKTAELYATVQLVSGILFTAFFLLGIWNWKNKKMNNLTFIGIFIVLIIFHFAHDQFEFFA